MVTYWIRKSATLLAIPQTEIATDPGQRIEALRSAEPGTISKGQRENLVHLQDVGDSAGWIKDLAVQRQAFRQRIEEREALREFGDQYRTYMQRVPACIPRLGEGHSARTS